MFTRAFGAKRQHMQRVSLAQYRNRKKDPVSEVEKVRMAQNVAREVGKGQMTQRLLVLMKQNYF